MKKQSSPISVMFYAVYKTDQNDILDEMIIESVGKEYKCGSGFGREGRDICFWLKSLKDAIAAGKKLKKQFGKKVNVCVFLDENKKAVADSLYVDKYQFYILSNGNLRRKYYAWETKK